MDDMLTTDPTTRLTQVIDTYLEAYALADATGRARLVAEAWEPHGSLLDPPFDGTGHDAIAGMTDVVLSHYPGHRFQRTTAIDTHHGIARYGWALVGPDGAVAVTGTDVAEVGPDGRLTRVVGFFGDLTPLDPLETDSAR